MSNHNKCAKRRYGARAHKAVSNRIIHNFGNVKQAIHDVLPGLYLPYCLSSRPNAPLASETSLNAAAILAKF